MGGVTYGLVSRKTKTYQSSAFVQIVLSTEQNGGYVDPNTLDELTNVYLEQAGSLAVYESAARSAGVGVHDLTRSVTPVVTEPGVIAFEATTPNPVTSARYANSVTRAFSAEVAAASAADSQARVSALESRIAGLETRQNSLPITSPKRGAYQSLVGILEGDVGNVLAAPATLASVIRGASASSSPVSPKPGRDAEIAAIVVLLLGPVLAYFVVKYSRRFVSAGHAATELGLPLICVVPKAAVDGSSVIDSLYLVHVEVVRRGHDERQASSPVVIVTSPRDGDGKTFTIRGLMGALRRYGSGAIFVDGDLGNRTLSLATDTGRSAGLSDVVTGQAALEAVLVPRYGSLEEPEALSLLPAGEPGLIARTALPAGALSRVMRSLGDKGIPVFIDAPSLLTNGDALSYVGNATGVLLVINARKTLRRDAIEAVRRVRNSSKPIIGIVYNAAPKRKSSRGHKS